MTNSEKTHQEHSDSHAVETDNRLKRLGDQLIQAREAKSMEIREVAECLKISAGYVRALESGHYELLPCTTFVRGYFKSYVKLLNLDEGKMLELFNAVEIPSDDVDSKASLDAASLHRKKQGIVMSAGLAFVLLFLMGGGIYLWRKGEPQNEVEVLALEAERTFQAEDNVDVVNSESLKKTDQTVNAISSAVDDGRLVIEFRADCWVRIKNVNNEVLFSDLKSAGTGLHLAVKGPLDIMFADMSAVQVVYYNDKPVTLDIPISGKIGRLKLG